MDLTGSCTLLVSMTWGGGSLWAIGKGRSGRDRLLKINPVDRSVEEDGWPVMDRESSIAYGDGALWIGLYRQSKPYLVMRVDPETRKVMKSMALRSETCLGTSVMWFDGGLWLVYAGKDHEMMVRIDPGNGKELLQAPMPKRWLHGQMKASGGTDGIFWGLQYPAGQIVKFDASFAGVK
jgi:hypothetical protein